MIARDEMEKGTNLSGLRPALDDTPMPGMDLVVFYMTHDRLGLYVGANHSDFFYVGLKATTRVASDASVASLLAPTMRYAISRVAIESRLR